MKNFLVIFILELLFDFTLSKKYQYDVFSSKPGFFIFEWEILNNERILITLEVKASGWVGFGVSKYGFMKNSDIIIGYLDSKNNPVVQDRFSSSYLEPQLDTKNSGGNDISDVSGSYKNNRLKITFSKPLNSPNKDDNGNDYSIIKGNLTPVIFAYKDGDNSMQKHTDMSSHRLILWPENEDQEVNQIDLSYKTDITILPIRLRMDNFKIPTEFKTNYYCKMFNVKKEIQKATKLVSDTAYHLVAYEPFLYEQRKSVHHIIVYSCKPEVLHWEDDYYECTKMPKGCNSILTIQALGSGPVVYPKEAGQLLGSGETEIVTLQVHYEHPNNLKKTDVLYDNSGFDFYFTTKLREFNIGVSMFGPPLELIEIPFSKQSFLIEDYCSEKCTNKIFKNNKIKVIGYFLHGHETLKDIKLSIFDLSKTIKNIFAYEDYDFNKQQIVMLQTPETLQKGDNFKIACEYNTINKTSNIKGGEASNEEMCFGFLFYYPKEYGISYCSNLTNLSSNFEICYSDYIVKPKITDIILDRNTMKFSGIFDVNSPIIEKKGNIANNSYSITFILILFLTNLLM